MKLLMMPITLLLVLFLTPAKAQEAQATAGPVGVFVQFEKLLHGPQYVMERLLVGNGGKPDWKPVCTTDKPPQSATDLISRLTILTRKNPLYEIHNDSLTTLFYERYRNLSSVDSLGTYRYNPQYLEALGVGFLDTDVEQGKRYDYRIRQLKNDETPVYHNPTTVSVPGSKIATTLKSVSYTADGKTVKIRYHVKKPRMDIAGVRAMRATYEQTDFSDCPAEWAFMKGGKDSLFLEITDRNARRKMLYSYVVFLKDFMGNETAPSDTLTLSNLRSQEELPVISDIRTSSEESYNTIGVAWKLTSTKNLRAIEIWRSDNYDSGYKLIGTASASDTIYHDQTVEPVQGYYYQIKLNGVYDRSSESVRVSGMLKASRPALIAPANLTVNEMRDTLYFTWQRADYDSHGYYLYYAASESDSLTQYSGVILASSDLSYKVPLSKLAMGTGYRWAVAAVNTSYNIGPISTPVYSEARYPDRVATPLNPEMIYHRGHAFLVWENMKNIDPNIIGYTIERKAGSEKVFKEIYVQSIDDKSRNGHEDFTVKDGERYTYRIKSLGINGKESGYSAETTYFKDIPPVLPVRGLSVMQSNKGVRIAWDAPLTAPEKIVIYRYTEKTIAAKMIGSVTGQQTEFIDKYASPGIGYYYSVVVMDAGKRESEPTDMVGVQWK
ncbi:fibronectin type III domain-containing protein [Dyadobacter sp. 32]|uniref:fibronectin type III domain-containing protein n=1 Tax=Dyadobacter sp. 32 TaxID=538966 RepID=UPI0011EBCD1D